MSSAFVASQSVGAGCGAQFGELPSNTAADRESGSDRAEHKRLVSKLLLSLQNMLAYPL